MTFQEKPSILIYGLASDELDRELPPIVTEIQNSGWRVVFVTNRQCKAAKGVDRFLVNSTWSYSFLKSIAIEESFSYCLLLTDFASPLIGRLNDEFKIPGPSERAFYNCSDKISWNNICSKAGLDYIEQEVFTSIEDFNVPSWKNRPLIVKPSKSSSNLSDLNCGYQYYKGAMDLFESLKITGELDLFLQTNREGGRMGRYLVQEKVNHKFWGSVNVSFLKDSWIIHEMNGCLYHPEPHQNLSYATYGPIAEIPQRYRLYAEKVCQIILDQGFHSHPACFDLLETQDGRLCTLDVNVRPSGTWNTLLPLRRISYYKNWLHWIQTGENKIPRKGWPFLRHILQLKPGQIPHLSSLLEVDSNMELRGFELIEQGQKVPQICARTTFPVEVIVVDENIEACFAHYNRFVQKIKQGSQHRL